MAVPSGQRPERIRAIAYDPPIVGWRRASVNTLRLWRARAEEDLQLDRSCRRPWRGGRRGQGGGIAGAVAGRSTEAGQELRLRQECFFV